MDRKGIAVRVRNDSSRVYPVDILPGATDELYHGHLERTAELFRRVLGDTRQLGVEVAVVELAESRIGAPDLPANSSVHE